MLDRGRIMSRLVYGVRYVSGSPITGRFEVDEHRLRPPHPLEKLADEAPPEV